MIVIIIYVIHIYVLLFYVIITEISQIQSFKESQKYNNENLENTINP